MNDETYIIQYADKPPGDIQLLGTEEMLSLDDSACVKPGHASLVSKRHLTLDGYPGHEVITKRPNGDQEINHFYLVGKRLYTLIAVQPPAQAGTTPTDASKFLDSFTFLPAKLPDTKLPDVKR